MGYWEEEAKKRRRKISESAANIFMVFCGFFGVYLLAAHMLYQDISAWSMLPYLIGGVAVAFLLLWLAGVTAPEALGRRKISDGEENGKRKTDAGMTGAGRNDAGAVGADHTGTDAKKRNRKKKNRSAAKNDVHQRTVYDRETAVRRWQALLTLAVCLVFFLLNFKYILRGSLVLADNIVFYFNYVFGTSCKISVDLFFGRYVTVLGSGNALYHLSDANIGAVTLVKSLGANSKVLFGTIAFYSALLKTEYSCGKKTVLADVLFGGALLAAAFLVGAYKTTWMGMCLLIYLVSLMIMFAPGEMERKSKAGEMLRGRRRTSRTEKTVRGRRRTSGTEKTVRGRKKNSGSEPSGSRKRKQSKKERLRGGKTHILTVCNAKAGSFASVLIFLVAAALCVSVYLIRMNSYFSDYDTPWIVEKWEQAESIIKGLPGNGSAGTQGGEDDAASAGTDDEDETDDVSWEPVMDEEEEEPAVTAENLLSGDTVLGSLTLEDEMREGSDTVYLKVLIDSGYYLYTNRLYLKCYSGEVYQGDAWGKIQGEDIGQEDEVLDYAETSLTVGTFDLFARCIEGTATEGESSGLKGLFDIGNMYRIRIRYMEESSLVFIPYYSYPVLWQHEADGEEIEEELEIYSRVAGFVDYVDFSKNVYLAPGGETIGASEVLTYDAAAANFGDEFLYGDGVSENAVDSFDIYEDIVLVDEVYLQVPESLTRLREEFSAVEIGGETYYLSDYDTDAGECLADDVGLGACIGYVISYLTENMTYSRSVAAVPDGADYIETFLFDRKTGYCSHYASAAVMMFRLFGIPARYAEGFAVDYNDAMLTTGGQYLVNVTGKSAHAWVEIYVTGVGWVAVNVTYGSSTAGEEGEETTLPGETTAPQATVTAQTEEESTAADGAGSGAADGKAGDSVFAKLSGTLQSIVEFFIKLIRVLKLPIVLLLLFELLRLLVRFARSLLLKWKCRGRSEEEKILIYAADLNRYIDRHLHIKKRRTMAQSQIAEAEGDLFARADGKAGDSGGAADGGKAGWHLFRYRVHGDNTAKPGRGRRRGPADLIVRMGARDGKALTAAEYEELLGLIRYAGRKTDAEERADLYLTMRKVKLVIYKESPWRRKVFF